MDDVLFWMTSEMEKKATHPLILIANFIFEFLSYPSFSVSGNGRLSRALTTLLLLKFGYTYVPYVSLDEIIEERKNRLLFSLAKNSV